MKKPRGKLIIFEGINASGKTSLIRLILKFQPAWHYCKGQGDKNTVWGRFARRHPSTFTLLIELLITNLLVVRPALKIGKIVLHDRYFFSIMAFYTAQRWYNRLLGKIILPFLVVPDLIFQVDVSAKQAIKRLNQETANPFHSLYLINPELIEIEKKYFNQSLGNDKIIIDTTQKNADDLVNLILQKIGGIINGR